MLSQVELNIPLETLCGSQEVGITLRWEGKGVNEKGYWIKEDSEVLIIRVDPRYFRPTEVDTLLGDASKAKEKLDGNQKLPLRRW